MKNILKKLNKDDFVYISKRLNSKFSFTNDKKRNKLVNEIKKKPNDNILSLMDNDIRYFASADLASAYRSLTNKETYVSTNVMLNDIIDKLKFNINKHLPEEDKLKRIVKEIVRKELKDAKPEDVEKMLNATDLNYSDISEVIYLIEKNDSDIVTTMIEHLGHNITSGIISSIIQKTILVVAGETALRILAGQFVKRNPGLQALGPAIWVLTGAWLAFDLQSTAYRKTIPVCLYVGMKLISKDVEDAAEQRRIENDKYNNFENKETKRILKENKNLKTKYNQLIEENDGKNKTNKLNHIQTNKIKEEHDKLRQQYNSLILKNSQSEKMGIKKHSFKVGQVRGIRDVFPSAIGIEADTLLIQDSYIRGKEREMDDLLRQFLNLKIIKTNTEVTFISLAKYGDVPAMLLKEMNPKLKAVCDKHNLIFETLKLKSNNEVHSRIFVFENEEMIIENNPDHSFYNLDRNKFAFNTFEEIIFK